MVVSSRQLAAVMGRTIYRLLSSKRLGPCMLFVHLAMFVVLNIHLPTTPVELVHVYIVYCNFGPVCPQEGRAMLGIAQSLGVLVTSPCMQPAERDAQFELGFHCFVGIATGRSGAVPRLGLGVRSSPCSRPKFGLCAAVACLT
jgi:hypothetical protein